jgi:hypothetical protein
VDQPSSAAFSQSGFSWKTWVENLVCTAGAKAETLLIKANKRTILDWGNEERGKEGGVSRRAGGVGIETAVPLSLRVVPKERCKDHFHPFNTNQPNDTLTGAMVTRYVKDIERCGRYANNSCEAARKISLERPNVSAS